MELGQFALIAGPSLWGLLPLLVYIVLIFVNMDSVVATLIGIAVGAVITGTGIGDLAKMFAGSLGSFVAQIGFIIMLGAGLGKLMNKARITHTLIYWIVKKIGVNSAAKARITLIIVSIVVCGLLGTLGGGNAVIAPILIPIMAQFGIAPSVVTVLFKTAGEVGLIWGPLTGVTLTTLQVTGLTYGRYMLFAGLPFGIIWLGGAWLAANYLQKRNKGLEKYDVPENIGGTQDLKITPHEKTATAAFLIAFLALVVYGIFSGQGTSYAIIVMILLMVVVMLFGRIKPNDGMQSVVEGVASMASLFLVFVTIDVLLNMVTKGGGFEALSTWLQGFISSVGASGVMLISSIVGGLGIEAAAVAEIKIISDLFGQMATNAALPMEMFAVSLLAATRLTGSVYPTSNLVGQMGIARSGDMKATLKGCWISIIPVVLYIVIWAFVGVRIL